MKRILAAPAFLLVLLGATQRHAMADDLVYYRAADTGKEAKDSPLKGKITREGPGGVTIALGRGNRVIPALDVIQIAFVTKDTDVSSYRSPYSKIEAALGLNLTTKAKERREAFGKALKDFSDLAKKDLRDNAFAARYVNYRIAEIEYHLAVDEAQPAKAIKVLEDYAAANPGGWEILLALKNLSRLYEEAGNVEKASATLARLADLPEVPKDIKREGDLAVSQLMMRTKRFDEAEKRLKSLLDSLPLGDPQRARTQVFMVQCRVAQKKTDGAEKELKDAISGTSDSLIRGIAYNVLGDYYREKGQTEEAFWAYLRVDAMYNADATEHAKAIYYLSELFKDKKFGDRTGDPVRARNYRERLMDKRFADTEYQKKAEKP